MTSSLERHDFSHYDPGLWPDDPLARVGLQLFLLEAEESFRLHTGYEISQQSIGFIAYYVVNGWAMFSYLDRDGSERTLNASYGTYTDKSPQDLFELARHTLRWALDHLEDGDGRFSQDLLDSIETLTSDL